LMWASTGSTPRRGMARASRRPAWGGRWRQLGAAGTVHLATKVRLEGGDLGDVEGAVRRSLAASLGRLRVERVTLLQLHNGSPASGVRSPPR